MHVSSPRKIRYCTALALLLGDYRIYYGSKPIISLPENKVKPKKKKACG